MSWEGDEAGLPALGKCITIAGMSIYDFICVKEYFFSWLNPMILHHPGQPVLILTHREVLTLVGSSGKEAIGSFANTVKGNIFKK